MLITQIELQFLLETQSVVKYNKRRILQHDKHSNYLDLSFKAASLLFFNSSCGNSKITCFIIYLYGYSVSEERVLKRQKI